MTQTRTIRQILAVVTYALLFITVRSQSGVPLTPIYDIQGSGRETPLLNQQVTTVGVVVGDFQEKEQLRGFFIQDSKGDGLAETSDGMFVYVPLGNKLSGVNVKVGDSVRVSGKVEEAFQQTQLGDVTEITLLGPAPALAPTTVTLPFPIGHYWEQFEGMLVTLPQVLTVTDNYRLGEYGQLMLSADGRLFHPRNGNDSETDQLQPNRWIMLDDGSTVRNPNPAPYLGEQGTRRVGDTITNLTGVLSFAYGEYRIHPTQKPEFEATNPRPLAPAAVGGDLKVASFNVLNYFTTLKSQDKTARGASTPEEFAQQSAKIVAALKSIDADIVGLMEIENHSRDALNDLDAINDLISKVNAAYGGPVYAAVPTPPEGLGSDRIRVAMIYKPASVQLAGEPITHTSPAFDRLPLAQMFAPVKDSKQAFLVVVNHFKSRGSCPDEGDIDTGSGCWNQKRIQQAQIMANFVVELQRERKNARTLLIGDINAYAEEDPLRALKSQGFIPLKDEIPAAQRYSYVFKGRSGSLDHALASINLKPSVTGVTVWPINADEPVFLEYSRSGGDALSPYRSSDHDPIVIGLRVN